MTIVPHPETDATSPDDFGRCVPNYPLAIVGAIAGGVFGYFGFAWLLRQGMHAGVLPGALIGLVLGYVLILG